MGADQREAYNEQKEKLFVFAAAGSSELDMMAMACHGHDGHEFP
jgi:hypothetical protein